MNSKTAMMPAKVWVSLTVGLSSTNSSASRRFGHWPRHHEGFAPWPCWSQPDVGEFPQWFRPQHLERPITAQQPPARPSTHSWLYLKQVETGDHSVRAARKRTVAKGVSPLCARRGWVLLPAATQGHQAHPALHLGPASRNPQQEGALAALEVHPVYHDMPRLVSPTVE